MNVIDLPFNVDVERSVLGALLLDGKSYERIAGLIQGDDFYDIKHKAIWGVVENICSEGELDLITVSDRLQKINPEVSSSYVAELYSSVSTSANIETHARLLKQYSTMRKLVSLGNEMSKRGGNTEDVSKVVQEASLALERIADESTAGFQSKDIVGISTKQQEALEVLRNTDKINGFATKIHTLDRIIGGIDVEELVIIGGQTGHGKSMLMQKVALGMAEQAPVLYLSLEMSVKQQVSRFYLMAKTIYEKPVESVNGLPIFFYDGKDSMNLTLLYKVIQEGIKQHGIKACFIDHLHYFSQQTDNVSSEIGLIVRTLKQYARKFQIPIVVVSTLRKLNNRSKTTPAIDDLKDSVMIGYDADIIMMIYRDVEGDANPSDVMFVSVRKNRPRGGTGGLKLQINDNFDLIEMR